MGGALATALVGQWGLRGPRDARLVLPGPLRPLPGVRCHGCVGRPWPSTLVLPSVPRLLPRTSVPALRRQPHRGPNWTCPPVPPRPAPPPPAVRPAGGIRTPLLRVSKAPCAEGPSTGLPSAPPPAPPPPPPPWNSESPSPSASAETGPRCLGATGLGTSRVLRGPAHSPRSGDLTPPSSGCCASGAALDPSRPAPGPCRRLPPPLTCACMCMCMCACVSAHV